MRKKERKIIITFPTATAAIHMEQCCNREKLPGRLIPVPSAVAAGCGLAWTVYPEEKDLILLMAEKERIAVEGTYEMEI